MNFFSPDHIGVLVDKLWDLVVVFVPRALMAGLIIILAMFIAQRASRGIFRILSRAGHIDDTLRYILAELVRYTVLVLAAVMALEQMGVRATSLLAVMGAAGLAIGLALQGTLSNIAAGLMLLWLRPFHIGDYIEVNNVPGLAGTVRQMGLFTCQLEAFDGLFLFVPNSGLWNVPLRNYTRNGGRLISLAITLPQDLGFESARDTLLDLARKNDKVAKDPEPLVFVEKVNADGMLVTFRIWASPKDVGELQRTMPGTVQHVLSAASKEHQFVQVVRTVPPDTDPSRLMVGAHS